MQAQSRRPVKTYTVGFEEESFDEAPFAKAVARHLGTDHAEIYVSSADATAVIQELPKIYDEPFADSSQIPSTLVSRLTRQHVTVSLSGDGAMSSSPATRVMRPQRRCGGALAASRSACGQQCRLP